MSDILSFFSNDPVLVIAIGVFLAVVILLVALLDDGNNKHKQRVDRLRQRGQLEIAAELKLRRRQSDQRPLDLLVRRLIPQPDLLRQRLRRTGRKISLGAYGVTCLVVAIIGGVGLYMAGISLSLAIPGGALVGLWLPHLAVGWLSGRRALAFTVTFPEAIGLMVRAVKSGLPITESFQIVGNEIPAPVGIEFRQITDQIKLGQPLDKVMWDAATRVGIPEMKFLVVTLSIQRETGGNLAETLENLDNILRRRRQMKLKIKAMSSEARASAMIIGALPFLMMAILMLINPDYIMQLFTKPLGHTLLAVAGGMMGMGTFVMSRMVRFEI
jgi:tight adherence protein B